MAGSTLRKIIQTPASNSAPPARDQSEKVSPASNQPNATAPGGVMSEIVWRLSLYLHHLEELSHKCRCAVHVYVLMTNHVHLLLTPLRKDGPSLLMKHLGQRYVQYVNRTYRRSGPLWEGRFRSSIVQEQGYLLRCYRHIELNPLRAGMVRQPRDYRWSSYPSNGEGSPSRLVKPHEEYLALGRQDDERLAAYRALFRPELDPKQVEGDPGGGERWIRCRRRA